MFVVSGRVEEDECRRPRALVNAGQRRHAHMSKLVLPNPMARASSQFHFTSDEECGNTQLSELQSSFDVQDMHISI